MVIAIDLDGVVFDTEEYYRTYAHLYDINLVKKGLINKEEMAVKDRHGWDQKIIDQFFEEYTSPVLKNAPIKPGAKYVINELKNLGHKLICITLRGYYRKCEIEITEERLKEAGIKFDKIIYNQHNKLAVCKEEKVDLIIEDNPRNIELLASNNIPCFHFRGAGLRKVNCENVIEVQNWADILENIIKIQK